MNNPATHETPHGIFHLGDCMKHLEALEPDGKTYFFTDPPWGQKKDITAGPVRGKPRHDHKKVDWNAAPGDDYFFIMDRFPYLCFGGNFLYPKLKKGGREFDLPTRWGMDEFVADNPKNWIIWDKQKPVNFSFSSFELIYTNAGMKTNRISYEWNGNKKEGRDPMYKVRVVHPCQKPPGLLMRIIISHIPQGATIIDPFAGSGSLAIAILKLAKLGMDYRYLCIEKDEDYYRDAIKWVEDEVVAVSLFRRA